MLSDCASLARDEKSDEMKVKTGGRRLIITSSILV